MVDSKKNPKAHPTTNYQLPTTKAPSLLAIVGPTASGKSGLAIQIAQQFDGEIICADSRTIYKGMDIGTAKPSLADQASIRHWGLDLVEPGQSYSAHQFKSYAEAAIADIQSRGKLPIIVGGTGLYIDAVLLDFGFRSKADPKERARLEKLNIEQLQAIVIGKGYTMPENSQNKRHLIRAIESKGVISKSGNLPPDYLVVGLMPETTVLKGRIRRRIDQMLEQGFIKEVKGLQKHYGEKFELTVGIGYHPALQFLKGEISETDFKQEFIRGHWQYARRQRTWFARHKFIQWFETAESAHCKITQIMTNSR